MEKIELKIEGMHCTGCSTRLERVLNNIEGVEKATVSLEDKKANIEYNEKQISLEKIKEEIKDAGFESF